MEKERRAFFRLPGPPRQSASAATTGKVHLIDTGTGSTSPLLALYKRLGEAGEFLFIFISLAFSGFERDKFVVGHFLMVAFTDGHYSMLFIFSSEDTLQSW